MALIDAGTALLLFAAAVGAMGTSRAALAGRSRSFYRLVAVGLALLAADELFNLQEHAHEGLHSLGFGDPPLLHGIDDLFMLGGGALAVAVCAWYWRELWAERRVALLLFAAAGILAFAVGIDSFGPQGGALPKVEELLELVAAGLISVGTWLRWRGAMASPQNAARRARRRAPQANRAAAD